MEFTYNVTYMKCQSCDAKIHCDQCSNDVLVTLKHSPDVESAFVDLGKKLVRISGQDEDALLDALDDLGIFTD